MQITTLPVFSKLADESLMRATFGDRALPVRLSQHQIETYRALIDTNVDVVINTAMTGDEAQQIWIAYHASRPTR